MLYPIELQERWDREYLLLLGAMQVWLVDSYGNALFHRELVFSQRSSCSTSQ